MFIWVYWCVFVCWLFDLSVLMCVCVLTLLLECIGMCLCKLFYWVYWCVFKCWLLYLSVLVFVLTVLFKCTGVCVLTVLFKCIGVCLCWLLYLSVLVFVCWLFYLSVLVCVCRCLLNFITLFYNKDIKSFIINYLLKLIFQS